MRLGGSLVNSKKLALFMAALLMSAMQVFASGGSECDDNSCTSFFTPNVLQTPQDSALFRSTRRIYRSDLNEAMQAVNAAEWFAYFKSAIPESMLRRVLYDLSRDEIQVLINAVASPRIPVDNKLSDIRAAFVKYGHTNQVVASLRYVALAKQVEPLALKNEKPEWTYPQPPPKPELNVDAQQLLAQINAQAPRVDRFLGTKYRFQALRILFYSGRYTEAQNYYERFARTFTIENSAKYRAMEIAGGAYYKEKKYAQANYLYSLVFDKFQPLKASSYLSFHPMEDADWKATLRLARNDHEREVLWQLLGIYADPVAAIDNIFQTNPKSPLLPLLLVREVNGIEESWTSLEFNGGSLAPILNVAPEAARYVNPRLARLKVIADSGKAYQPHLWFLATGHLFALAGDTAQAQQYLERAAKTAPDVEVVQHQIRASQIFARVRAVTSVDKSAESILAADLNSLDSSYDPDRNLKRWALRHLSAVYEKAGDRVRAHMLDAPYEAEIYQSASAVDEILSVMKSASTDFDRFLLSNFRLNEGYMQQMRALHYLYAGEFAKATEAFNTAAGATSALAADPFEIHINDCHSCDAERPHEFRTRSGVAERLLELSGIAAGSGQAAADASFGIANALYNISHYGNARSLKGSDYATNVFLGISAYATRDDKNVVLNMDLVEKYYVQAANLSTDKEFKAKALFMAAKAEQNRSYNTSGPNPRLYFARLKDQFSDTQYYQEIIKECGRFKAYLER